MGDSHLDDSSSNNNQAAIEQLRGQIELNREEKQAYYMISNDIQSKP